MSGKHEERPERPSEVDGTAHLFKALGKILKVLRQNAGLSQAQLAADTHCSEDLVSAMERGVRTPQPEFLLRAEDVLRAGGVLAAAVEDTERAIARARVRHPDWFRSFAAAEASAVALHYYEVQAVPGLLQTEAYARAVMRHRRPVWDEETIEKWVADRLARQSIFDKWPPTTISFVLEEAILRRPTGGADVHREQLRHIARIANRRTVHLQVMPLGWEEHPSLDGAFTLLTPPGRREVAYTEIYGHPRLITAPEEVHVYSDRYGIIRAQALTPRESLELIEKMLGEL
ncbi:Scr1 family TA system antitoxin-like transcriptional regulator [Streptomyces sp. NPDC004435]|uniref:helix-turn-helix domain-containing protein n=1 Tax=Streptomyces sp. NPDC004435 TaxID=3364701 RepID=UPI00369AB35F